MSESPRDHRDTSPTPKAEPNEDVYLEEEDKILNGRHDVNYPALLTRDVKGG